MADAIREESHEAVRALHERGIEVAMLTEDSRAVAQAVAQKLEIDTVFAEVLPEDKAFEVKMLQNLWWAAGYNLFAIPLAAGVLAAWGILLTPALGAVLMSASTVIVAINAQLLKRTSL